MPDLPRIPKRLVRLDFLIEVCSFIILLESWTYSVYTYNHLSDAGNLSNTLSSNNAFASKDTIWVFPILATLTFIAITVISSVPHKFTYKETITRLNARRIYRKAVRRLRVLKLILVSMFGLGVLFFAQYSNEGEPQANSFVSLFSFILLVLPTIYLLFLVYSKQKRTEH